MKVFLLSQKMMKDTIIIKKNFISAQNLKGLLWLNNLSINNIMHYKIVCVFSYYFNNAPSTIVTFKEFIINNNYY